MKDSSNRPVRSGSVRAIVAAAIVVVGIAILVLGSRYINGKGIHEEHGGMNLVVPAERIQARALAHAAKRNDKPLRATRRAHAKMTVKADPRRVSIALGTALTFREGFEKNKATDLRETIRANAGPAPRRSFHLAGEVIMGRRAELQRDLHSPKYEEFTYVPVNFLGVMQPLLDIAIEADRPRIAQMLIADGANVNGVASGANAWTMTPLAYAAQLDNTHMVRLLLEHGAKIDERGPRGNGGIQPTPLGYAISQAPDTAFLLLKHGASLQKALGPGMIMPNLIAYPTAHGYREGAADTARIDRLRSQLVSEGAILPPRKGGQ